MSRVDLRNPEPSCYTHGQFTAALKKMTPFLLLSSAVICASFLCLYFKGSVILYGRSYLRSSVSPCGLAVKSTSGCTNDEYTIRMIENIHFLIAGLNISSMLPLIKQLLYSMVMTARSSGGSLGSPDLYPLIYVCFMNIIFLVSNVDTIVNRFGVVLPLSVSPSAAGTLYYVARSSMVVTIVPMIAFLRRLLRITSSPSFNETDNMWSVFLDTFINLVAVITLQLQEQGQTGFSLLTLSIKGLLGALVVAISVALELYTHLCSLEKSDKASRCRERVRGRGMGRGKESVRAFQLTIASGVCYAAWLGTHLLFANRVLPVLYQGLAQCMCDFLCISYFTWCLLGRSAASDTSILTSLSLMNLGGVPSPSSTESGGGWIPNALVNSKATVACATSSGGGSEASSDDQGDSSARRLERTRVQAFLRFLIHELSSPLSGISMATEVLDDHVRLTKHSNDVAPAAAAAAAAADGATEEVEEALALTKSSVEYLSNVLGEVVWFQKSTYGKRSRARAQVGSGATGRSKKGRRDKRKGGRFGDMGKGGEGSGVNSLRAERERWGYERMRMEGQGEETEDNGTELDEGRDDAEGDDSDSDRDSDRGSVAGNVSFFRLKDVFVDTLISEPLLSLVQERGTPKLDLSMNFPGTIYTDREVVQSSLFLLLRVALESCADRRPVLVNCSLDHDKMPAPLACSPRVKRSQIESNQAKQDGTLGLLGRGVGVRGPWDGGFGASTWAGIGAVGGGEGSMADGCEQRVMRIRVSFKGNALSPTEIDQLLSENPWVTCVPGGMYSNTSLRRMTEAFSAVQALLEPLRGSLEVSSKDITGTISLEDVAKYGDGCSPRTRNRKSPAGLARSKSWCSAGVRGGMAAASSSPSSATAAASATGPPLDGQDTHHFAMVHLDMSFVVGVTPSMAKKQKQHHSYEIVDGDEVQVESHQQQRKHATRGAGSEGDAFPDEATDDSEYTLVNSADGYAVYCSNSDPGDTSSASWGSGSGSPSPSLETPEVVQSDSDRERHSSSDWISGSKEEGGGGSGSICDSQCSGITSLDGNRDAGEAMMF